MAGKVPVTGNALNHDKVVFDVIGGCALAHPRIFAVITPGLADGLHVADAPRWMALTLALWWGVRRA